jgi:hypothetical protein
VHVGGKPDNIFLRKGMISDVTIVLLYRDLFNGRATIPSIPDTVLSVSTTICENGRDIHKNFCFF